MPQNKNDLLPSLERVYQAAIVNVLPQSGTGTPKPDSAELRYYVDPNILFIDAKCNPLTIRRIFAAGAKAPMAVIHEAGKVVGVITPKYLEQSEPKEGFHSARDLMIPWKAVITADITESLEEACNRMGRVDFLIVMKNGRPFGTLWASDLPGPGVVLERTIVTPAPEDFIRIFNLMPEGIFVTGPDSKIIYANNAAVKMFSTTKKAIVGKNLNAAIGKNFAANHHEYRRCSPVYEVVKKLKPVYNYELKMLSGRTFQMNCLPVVKKGKLAYLVLNFRDVSGEKKVIELNQTAYREMTEAFRVMLPTTRIEKRLKSIPEYQDVFNPTTGFVEVVEVIPDGAYRHVINCLNIVSELHKKGIFNVPELERAVVVQALLLHDIGKKQPVLKAGDIVDPQKVFPDGKRHARISAGMIRSYPLVSPDVIPLIFYHHHREDELPAEFPERLLPMWRLLRMVDGLSAAITRRHAQLDIWVEESRVVVLEKNPHPYYNGVRHLDVLSGKGFFQRDNK